MMKLRNITDKITTIGVGVGMAYLIAYGGYKVFQNKETKFPEENHIFESINYKKEYISHFFVDIDGDKKPDYVAVSYDFNGNKIPDVSAFYPITGISSNGDVKSSTIANLVVVDKNEDGAPDYILIDEDHNGILEKKVINGTKFKSRKA